MSGQSGSLPLGRIVRRADYVAVGRGQRIHAKPFSLQVLQRPADETGAASVARFGLTVSRKVGKAVERNRVKRRLRAALRGLPGDAPRPGHDYVIVARRDALDRPFAALVADLVSALARANRGRERGKSPDSRDIARQERS